jgi:hypothetical protein
LSSGLFPIAFPLRLVSAFFSGVFASEGDPAQAFHTGWPRGNGEIKTIDLSNG